MPALSIVRSTHPFIRSSSAAGYCQRLISVGQSAFPRNYSGSREEVQLLADKSFGQPEKKLNFWLSSYFF